MSPSLASSLWPATRTSLPLQVLLALAGSLLLAASAQVHIPVAPVPFTLHTMMVVLIGAVYGPYLGAATVVLYLLEGAAGLPVFEGFSGGLSILGSFTAGYLIGMPIAAFIAGWFTRSIRTMALPLALAVAFMAFVVADTVVFGLGYAWLSHLIGSEKAWAGGVQPFLLWDALKMALAAAIVTGAWRTLPPEASV
jgi:biotin transport system substrate-specific component